MTSLPKIPPRDIHHTHKLLHFYFMMTLHIQSKTLSPQSLDSIDQHFHIGPIFWNLDFCCLMPCGFLPIRMFYWPSLWPSISFLPLYSIRKDHKICTFLSTPHSVAIYWDSAWKFSSHSLQSCFLIIYQPLFLLAVFKSRLSLTLSLHPQMHMAVHFQCRFPAHSSVTFLVIPW